MTKLSEKIPIKYIKKSSKLQEIETKKIKDNRWLEDDNPKVFLEETELTIADIIDNAEELFGKEQKVCNVIISYKWFAEVIFGMCLKNKSINEIANYVIENIN